LTIFGKNLEFFRRLSLCASVKKIKKDLKIRMKNIKLNFLFIIFVISSCNSSVDRNDLIGLYKNSSKEANDYNQLILRADSTFSFVQCPNCGDAWFHYNGKWETKNNSVFLYDGFDFSDYLVLDTICNSNSDTLQIELDSTLLKRFPNLKLSIEEKNELNFIGNELSLLKTDYLKKLNYKDNDFKYGDYPISLLLRHKNYYAYIGYIFANQKIKISIKENVPNDEKNMLVKYSVNDSILDSFSESYKVKKNKMKKLNKLEVEMYDDEL
jgi:hypothetical protein